MIVEGTLISLIISLIVIAFSLYFKQQAEEGKIPFIRKIPALDSIDEVISRCSEMGKKCHLNPGQGALTGEYAPQTIAGLTIIAYAAEKCAQLGVPIIASFENPQPIPLAIEMLRTAYIKAGDPEAFSEDCIRFYPDKAYRLACWGINSRENIGAGIFTGVYWGSNYGLFESAKLVGAMIVGGTARMVHVPTIAVQSDYSMLGEELFAAQAYVEKAPFHVGCLAGQDIGKYVTILLVLLGAIISTAGSDLIKNLLVM